MSDRGRTRHANDDEPRWAWWLWPNLLALDAPLVALVWQQFLGEQIGETVPMTSTITLAFTVWALYLGDRLFDARTDSSNHLAARHHFAGQHPRLIASLTLIAVVVAGFTASQLSAALLAAGAGVAVVVGGYFLAVHLGNLPGQTVGSKELLVGCLFAIGVGLPILAETTSDAIAWVPAFLALVGLFVLNCVLIARWETIDQHHAPGVWLPVGAASVAVIASGFCVLPMAVAVIASVGLLAGLQFLRHRLGPERLRVLADGALLTPLVVGVWP